VISILADKDYSEMIRLFCQKANKIFVAQNKSDRAASAEDQLREISKHKVSAQAYTSVAEAYQNALAETGREGVLVAGGSLYTVGEIISVHNADA